MKIKWQLGLCHGLKKLGNRRENRRPIFDDFPENIFCGRQGFDQQYARPDGQGQRHAHRHHKAVEHRQQQGKPIPFIGAENFLTAFDIGHNRPVGQHRPLGFPGGSRGVNDDGDILGINAGETIGRRAPGLGEFMFDKVNPGQPGQFAPQRLMHVPKVTGGNEHFHLTIIENVFDFPGLEHVIDRHDGRPAEQCPVKGENVVGRIPEQNAHTVPLAHAHGGQGQGQLAHFRINIAIGDFLPVIDDGHLARLFTLALLE